MAQPTCTLHPFTSDSDFTSTLSALPPTTTAILYFHAPWAEPCKAMHTILSTLASTYPATNPPTTAFYTLDAEEVADVSERYDVSQVPLVVVQKDGKVVEAVTGTDAGKVRAAVEKSAGRAGAGAGEGGAAGGLPPAQKVVKPAQDTTVDPAQEPQGSGAAGGAGGADVAAAAPEMSKEELDARLAELVKAAPVMLFMKGTPSAPQCGFSRQTVGMLREKGVRYGFFNILADDEVRQGLKEYSEWPTFPQVYVGGELVGGLDILKEEFENDPEFLKDYSVTKAQPA